MGRREYFLLTIYILIYIMYRSSDYRKTIILIALYRVPYILKNPSNLFRVGLKSRLLFDFRTRGGLWCLGFDREESRTSIAWTRGPRDQEIRHVLQIGNKGTNPDRRS